MVGEGEAKTAAMTDGLERLREEEAALLLEDGFELAGSDGLLWLKECVCYGREAALQTVRRSQAESEGSWGTHTHIPSFPRSYERPSAPPVP